METFSPVVKPNTIRIVLNVAVVCNWKTRQLDLENAFLHGGLDTPVYMEQPSGFCDPAQPDNVYLLHCALYGLKQAPPAWFDKFNEFLTRYSLFCSTADASLLVY